MQQLFAAKTISPASRAVLILHFQEELPLADVAAILDIPLGTAKSRLAYGLTAIRKFWNESGGSHVKQLIVLRRARQRAPNLTLSDRLLCGFWSLFLSPDPS